MRGHGPWSQRRAAGVWVFSPLPSLWPPVGGLLLSAAPDSVALRYLSCGSLLHPLNPPPREQPARRVPAELRMRRKTLHPGDPPPYRRGPSHAALGRKVKQPGSFSRASLQSNPFKEARPCVLGCRDGRRWGRVVGPPRGPQYGRRLCRRPLISTRPPRSAPQGAPTRSGFAGL